MEKQKLDCTAKRLRNQSLKHSQNKMLRMGNIDDENLQRNCEAVVHAVKHSRPTPLSLIDNLSGASVIRRCRELMEQMSTKEGKEKPLVEYSPGQVDPKVIALYTPGQVRK